jgi:hypothetical protein
VHLNPNPAVWSKSHPVGSMDLHPAPVASTLNELNELDDGDDGQRWPFPVRAGLAIGGAALLWGLIGWALL